jgi:quercetin dioxygenase-like cupin family protein
LAIRYLLRDQLPGSDSRRDFVGSDEGGFNVSFRLVDSEPGQGPPPHRHPYVEILVVVDGAATFDDGENKRVVSAGEMAIVDPGQPHGFVNSGKGRLLMTNIHLSPRIITE